jgi:hypothetical protein
MNKLLSNVLPCMFILCNLLTLPLLQRYQWYADVRVRVAAVGGSSNRACAMCPTVAKVS